MKIGKYLEYIEWFLYDTQTRRHKYFVMYYNLVELRFKYNLSICLLDNLKVYEMWLLGHFSLLNLKLILSPDGLIYDPDIKQLLSNTNEFLFNMIYGFGRLPRWMSESALTVPRAVSEKYGTARKERNQDIGSDWVEINRDVKFLEKYVSENCEISESEERKSNEDRPTATIDVVNIPSSTDQEEKTENAQQIVQLDEMLRKSLEELLEDLRK
ncbi:hypothetical protein O3M35_009764 [Rhynocoris fuscipes]|uniref:Uncharacterized protein n=1 Tax=Rhynocoris fuscipes TaxID=488301 RepID=A0AAW1D7Q4_9HEMI